MTAPAQGDWLGQPKGLSVLFLTEMWETFSFYGMRALLVYYMIKALGFSATKASIVYGLYAAFIYFTPIIGGVIADRALGRRRSVILGGSLMALGHLMMTQPDLFYPALIVIVIGNGFYLPNLASQIDGLYAPGDPRLASAYNVYYVGINVGGFIAPLVCGALGEGFGWHYGFGAASIGMVAGLAIYVWGSRLLPPEPTRRDRARPSVEPSANDRPPSTLAPLLGAVLLAVIVFRGAYEQIGNTIALWADTYVQRRAGGFLIPASWFQSLNPLLVFLLTPLLIRLWTAAARRGRERSSLQRMAVGGFGLMAAYLGLAAVAAASGAGHASWLYLAAFIGVYTWAELHILPVGLGLFASLAPQRHKATMIALWFLASFAGNLLAGALGTLWTGLGPVRFFLLMAAFGGASSAGLAALAPLAKQVDKQPIYRQSTAPRVAA